MKPLFFGATEAPLYGVHHPPRTEAPTARAVLACYPVLGAEYMRAHRAFRQLVSLLTRGGAHVLRFDYAGTGDSAGESEQASLARWQEDIGAAVGELRELSDARTVTIVGLRLGGTLAALAGGRHPDVERIVLWDPIVDGAAHAAALEATHAAEQRGRGGPAAGADVIGVHGFPVTAAQRAELRTLDLRQWAPARPVPVDLVVSSEQPAWTALAAHLRGLPGGGRYVLSPSAGNWDESDAFGSALIPQQIIGDVVQAALGGAS